MKIKFMLEGSCTMDDVKIEPNETMLESETSNVLMEELEIDASIYVSNLEIIR